MDEAVRRLTTVADSGSRDYASLAKLVLSQIYAGQGKTAEAEKLLRGLIDKPTLLVTKEEATIALGRLLTPTRPEEARKMLDPLQKVPGPVGRAAVLAHGESGLTVRSQFAGMALAEDHPDSKKLVDFAVEKMKWYLEMYGAEGEFNESPDYAGANRHGHLRCRLRSRIGAKGG